MGAITTGGYLAIAAIVAGTAVNLNAQQRAATDTRRAERKTAALGRARDAFLNAQRTKQALAQARVAAAQTRAIGEAQGVSNSSSVQGAAGAVFTNTALQIGASQVEQAAGFGINTVNRRLSRKLQDYGTQGQIGQGIASIGSAYLGSGAGFSKTALPTLGAPGASLASRNPTPPPSFNARSFTNMFQGQDMFTAARRGLGS